MPDLITAIENALNKTKEKQMHTHKTVQVPANTLTPVIEGWHKEEAARTAPVVATPLSVTQAVFECVRDNPGITRVAATDRLVKQGYKKMSVTSLISQMIRGEQATVDANNGLHTTLTKYVPIKNNEQLKKIREKNMRAAKRIAAKASTGIAALNAQTSIEKVREYVAKVEATPVDTSGFDADKLLSTLSFTQTIDLYKRLQQILGAI
jgi:hypothetical protein